MTTTLRSCRSPTNLRTASTWLAPCKWRPGSTPSRVRRSCIAVSPRRWLIPPLGSSSYSEAAGALLTLENNFPGVEDAAAPPMRLTRRPNRPRPQVENRPRRELSWEPRGTHWWVLAGIMGVLWFGVIRPVVDAPGPCDKYPGTAELNTSMQDLCVDKSGTTIEGAGRRRDGRRQVSKGAWIGVAGIVTVAVLGLLLIGTLHRDNCIKAKEVGCTLVPWSGHRGNGCTNGQPCFRFSP